MFHLRKLLCGFWMSALFWIEMGSGKPAGISDSHSYHLHSTPINFEKIQESSKKTDVTRPYVQKMFKM
jgi:hypothetical protein